MSKRSIPSHFGPAAEPSLLALRGIRLFSGEDGAGGGGEGGNQGGQGGDGGNGGENSGGNGGGQQGGQQQQSGGGQGGSQGGGQQQGGQQTSAGKDGTFSREYVSELRNENATRRKNETALETRATTAETERDGLKAQLADLTRRDAVRGAAGDGGGNVDLLLDSASFERATKDVDVSDKPKLVQAIKDFVAANPSYATATSAGSSGSGRAGGAHQGGADTSNSLAGAVGAALARS